MCWILPSRMSRFRMPGSGSVPQRRQALAAKLSGSIPRTHTRWIASYRWVNGSALTPVDMFNASPGQGDAFLNLFVRQPIPTMGFLPAHMEALIDLRNLAGAGLCAGDGPGRPNGLFRAVRPFCAGRGNHHLLDQSPPQNNFPQNKSPDWKLPRSTLFVKSIVRIVTEWLTVRIGFR
jgi:hypothetical protein